MTGGSAKTAETDTDPARLIDARIEQLRHAMRVRIASQQQRLKEQHAGRPDRRTAAKPGQNDLANDRLDKKQKHRAQQCR